MTDDPPLCRYCSQLFLTIRQRAQHESACTHNPDRADMVQNPDGPPNPGRF